MLRYAIFLTLCFSAPAIEFYPTNLFVLPERVGITGESQVAVEHLSSGAQPQAPTEEGADRIHFRYYFENERFVIPFQEVLIEPNGRGHYRFKKKDTDELTLDFDVSPRVTSEMQGLIDQLAFFNSTESYQHKKDFSHLGTMTLAAKRGGIERTVTFNYTDNGAMNQLVQIFRGIATQENRIFEMETVRANDPISMPAQLRILEGELKSRNVADPNRFAPILNDLKGDESVPLIARNHAVRLLLMIEKLK